MPRQLAPCGTNPAYQRHLRHGQKPCDACRLAHNAFVADYRKGVGHPRQLAECGTPSGYSRHRYRREPICEPCREAHRQAMCDWRKARKAKAAAFDDALAGALAELRDTDA